MKIYQWVHLQVAKQAVNHAMPEQRHACPKDPPSSNTAKNVAAKKIERETQLVSETDT